MEFDKPRIAADINKHDEYFFHIHEIIPFSASAGYPVILLNAGVNSLQEKVWHLRSAVKEGRQRNATKAQFVRLALMI
jgi:hypothetical protein